MMRNLYKPGLTIE